MKGYILTAVLLCLLAFTVHAQDGMGIGTTNPDNSAVLEIKSATKGLLTPRMGTSAVNTIDNPAEGLIIFDTDKNTFVFNAGPSGTKNWFEMTPMLRVNSTTIKNLSSPFEGMLVYDTSKDLFVYNAGTATTPRWLELSPYRQGMIMMWSGTDIRNIPYGWALCDGGYYDSTGTAVASTSPNAIQTPDLAGRFVVGYDASSSSTPTNSIYGTENYRLIGNTGGRTTVTLIRENIPSHRHTVQLYTNTDGAHTHDVSWSRGDPQEDTGSNEPDRSGGGSAAKDGYPSVLQILTTGSSHRHYINGNTGYYGGGTGGFTQGHENRPPYYVLAYIMKL